MLKNNSTSKTSKNSKTSKKQKKQKITFSLKSNIWKTDFFFELEGLQLVAKTTI